MEARTRLQRYTDSHNPKSFMEAALPVKALSVLVAAKKLGSCHIGGNLLPQLGGGMMFATRRSKSSDQLHANNAVFERLCGHLDMDPPGRHR